MATSASRSVCATAVEEALGNAETKRTEVFAGQPRTHKKKNYYVQTCSPVCLTQERRRDHPKKRERYTRDSRTNRRSEEHRTGRQRKVTSLIGHAPNLIPSCNTGSDCRGLSRHCQKLTCAVCEPRLKLHSAHLFFGNTCVCMAPLSTVLDHTVLLFATEFI